MVILMQPKEISFPVKTPIKKSQTQVFQTFGISLLPKMDRSIEKNATPPPALSKKLPVLELLPVEESYSRRVRCANIHTVIIIAGWAIFTGTGIE